MQTCETAAIPTFSLAYRLRYLPQRTARSSSVLMRSMATGCRCHMPCLVGRWQNDMSHHPRLGMPTKGRMGMAGRFNNSDVAWLIPFRPVVAKESRVLCSASHGYLHVAFTPERGPAEDQSRICSSLPFNFQPRGAAHLST